MLSTNVILHQRILRALLGTVWNSQFVKDTSMALKTRKINIEKENR